MLVSDPATPLIAPPVHWNMLPGKSSVTPPSPGARVPLLSWTVPPPEPLSTPV